MRYITRELYLSMQGLPDAAMDEASRRWDEACNAYRLARAEIKSQLPPGMRAFAEVTLHDGVITSAVQPRPDHVVLGVDASRNPWGPRGRFRVEFVGVQEVSGLPDMIDDDWLYEEVHLHNEKCFEYCVLLSCSEFRVVAEEVAFGPLSW